MAESTDEPGAQQPIREAEAGLTRLEIRMRAAERARKAMQLRTMRVSWDQIAKQCGYSSRSAAHKAVKRELESIPREAAIQLRSSELESLDVAQRALATRISQGDLGAVDRLIRIMDMRAKLTGLYEPQPDSGVDEVKVVMTKWLAQLQKGVDDDERDDDELVPA